MKKDLHKFILTSTTEQIREFVEEYDDRLLHLDDNQRGKIMDKFIDLLAYSELYNEFNFGEIAVFINSQDYILTSKQRDTIIKHICDNLSAFANSKNEKVNIFMFDLIGNCIDNEIIKKYCDKLDIKCLDKREIECVNIMLNGY